MQPSGCNAIHHAAMSGSKKSLDAILDALSPADRALAVKTPIPGGYEDRFQGNRYVHFMSHATPMHIAAYSGSLPTMYVLMSHGAGLDDQTSVIHNT